MKRTASSLAVAAVCIVAPVQHAAAMGPSEDLVSGTGQGIFATQFGLLSSQAHVNARGGPSGARGQTWARFFDTPVGDVLIKGSVFCLNADENEAVIGTIVEQSNTPFVPPGSAVLRKVIDNGEGSNDPADQTGTISMFPPPPSCPPPAVAPIGTGPVDQGNFVVKDGS